MRKNEDDVTIGARDFKEGMKEIPYKVAEEGFNCGGTFIETTKDDGKKYIEFQVYSIPYF